MVHKVIETVEKTLPARKPTSNFYNFYTALNLKDSAINMRFLFTNSYLLYLT
jgi:hypothetical protein